MSFPDRDTPSVEFRPEFVDGIVEFFGGQFDTLSLKERTHAIGVVANTLASLAMNQTRTVDASGVMTTLGILSNSTNEIIDSFVHDESAGNLFPQSLRICEIIREAIERQKQQPE